MYLLHNFEEREEKNEKKVVKIKKVMYNNRIYVVHQQGSDWYTINDGSGMLRMISRKDAKVVRRGEAEV